LLIVQIASVDIFFSLESKKYVSSLILSYLEHVDAVDL